MIPLFKSHFSMNGRSLLKVEDVFGLHKESGNDKLVVVEDTFASFRKFFTKAQDNGIHLVFGVRLGTVKEKVSKEKPSKLIYFAKNADGLIALKKIYSHSFENSKEAVKLDKVDEAGLLKNVQICVPFYDSFLYNNIFNFGMSDINVEKYNPIFFEEHNYHPHDHLIQESIDGFAKNFRRQKVKSIYYRERKDFKAFQAFKAICNRPSGKSPTFDHPMTDGLCSDEFCFESYLENESD